MVQITCPHTQYTASYYKKRCSYIHDMEFVSILNHAVQLYSLYCVQVNEKFLKWRHRDGVKRKGDKDRHEWCSRMSDTITSQA